jgi:hypothetical protein
MENLSIDVIKKDQKRGDIDVNFKFKIRSFRLGKFANVFNFEISLTRKEKLKLGSFAENAIEMTILHHLKALLFLKKMV